MHNFRGKCCIVIGRIINMLVFNFVAVAVYHRQSIIAKFCNEKRVAAFLKQA